MWGAALGCRATGTEDRTTEDVVVCPRAPSPAVETGARADQPARPGPRDSPSASSEVHRSQDPRDAVPDLLVALVDVRLDDPCVGVVVIAVHEDDLPVTDVDRERGVLEGGLESAPSAFLAAP